MKKIAKLILAAATLLSIDTIHAAEGSLGSSDDKLTRLLGDSRWEWYYGERKRVNSWIEFYKDGTARVPWCPQLQQWTITPPNTLNITGVGPKSSDYIFTMDAARKAGDQAGGGLHIRHDKKLSDRR